MRNIGILLTNTGTPDAPTPHAVRKYLQAFLSDKRVVHLPAMVWLPILYGLILPTRAHRSAALYQAIWTAEGSPMRVIMQRLAYAIEKNSDNFKVALGMHYGNPSIPAGLTQLTRQNVEKVIVLPLFPQYSHTTTGATLDRLLEVFKQQPLSFELSVLSPYATSNDYIQALATQIKQHRQHHPGADHLLISFHGIPERFVQAGDPYAMHCEQTAQLLATALQLPNDKWTLCYQSQFGYDRWLKPSTQHLFTELPKRGVRHLEVICPGFPIDCLETLEEMNIRGQKKFLAAGGQRFHYIPALNETDLHVKMLTAIIKRSC